MRITLNIPDNLLNEAMALTHSRTKTAVIKKALEQLIQKHKITQLKDYFGKVRLEVDTTILRGRRESNL